MSLVELACEQDFSPGPESHQSVHRAEARSPGHMIQTRVLRSPNRPWVSPYSFSRGQTTGGGNGPAASERATPTTIGAPTRPTHQPLRLA